MVTKTSVSQDLSKRFKLSCFGFGWILTLDFLVSGSATEQGERVVRPVPSFQGPSPWHRRPEVPRGSAQSPGSGLPPN